MAISTDAHQTAETKALDAVYAAINRNDIPAALKYFHQDIERIEPDNFPSTGTYHGLSEFEAHLIKGRSSWAEGSCSPEGFMVANNKVVVLLHVKVKLKKNLEWVEGRIADGFTFRDGKINFMRTFAEREEALQWINTK